MRNTINLDHPLVIRQTTDKDIQGEGYTIFKNTDKELVDNIKALNTEGGTWEEYGYKGQCKIDKVLNNTQRLCVDEDGKYFIKDVGEFQETKQVNLLNAINRKFNVAEYLNTLNLYSEDGYRKIQFINNGIGLRGADYDSHGKISCDEIGIKIDTHNGIYITEGNCGGSSMFCHFDVDGNIANRDYNYDFKYNLGCKPKSRQHLVDEILSIIPDVPYQNYKNKYFAKDFAFIIKDPEEGYDSGQPEFKFVLTVNRLDKYSTADNYGDSISGREKLPKTTVPATRKDILSKILPVVNEIKHIEGGLIDLSKYYGTESLNGVELKVKNKPKRSKIIKSKFSEIFDLTTADEIIYNAEVMEAIVKISVNDDMDGRAETLVKDVMETYLHSGDLPSFSFNKGEQEPNHLDYTALVKLPHDVNFKFRVEEGDTVEITWAHSIYSTDIVELELI